MEEKNLGDISEEQLSSKEKEKSEQLSMTHMAIVNTMKENKVSGISLVVSDIGEHTAMRCSVQTSGELDFKAVAEGICSLLIEEPLLLMYVVMMLDKKRRE